MSLASWSHPLWESFVYSMFVTGWFILCKWSSYTHYYCKVKPLNISVKQQARDTKRWNMIKTFYVADGLSFANVVLRIKNVIKCHWKRKYWLNDVSMFFSCQPIYTCMFDFHWASCDKCILNHPVALLCRYMAGQWHARIFGSQLQSRRLIQWFISVFSTVALCVLTSTGHES